MPKIDSTLFNVHAQTQAKGGDVCPQCGEQLVMRHGKHGPFWGCAAYPACNYVRALSGQGGTIEKVLNGSRCPECGEVLVIRKGRYGLFIACSQFPDCRHVEQELDKSVEASAVPCPVCRQGHLVPRTSRQGKTFYACDGYPRCRFVLNDRPVAQRCPLCGGSILVHREGKHGPYLCCPQKHCTYRSDSL